MRVLFFHKYGSKAASFRHRLAQFVPYLTENGIVCEISSLLDDQYLERKFSSRKTRWFDLIAAACKRAYAVLSIRNFDAVVLYYELFPYVPSIFENYLSRRGIPIIYDFDDAIFHNYDLNSSPIIRGLLGQKIKKIIQQSSAIIAGNDYLANYAKSVNPNVVVIPTVIDLLRYHSKSTESIGPKTITLGWIGSPSTAKYLMSISGALRTVCEKSDTQVTVIGAGPLEIAGVPLKSVPWSEETEVSEMLKFDIGIMPLTKEPWSEGKCGFKLIQYMGCGLPVIASPVGVNSQIVEHGVNGYLAENEAEWCESLLTLIGDHHKRHSFGIAGRAKVEENYSLQARSIDFLNVLQKLKRTITP